MSNVREVYKQRKYIRFIRRKMAQKKYSSMISKNQKSRILVILHLYYQQSWIEIKEYLENLSMYSYDLIVTFSKNNIDEKVYNEVKNWPNTKDVIICENKGFDLGPFVTVLNNINLDEYDIVFKLQSKSTKRAWIYIYKQLFFRRDWFVNLYEGILGERTVHTTIDSLMNNDKVGLVAAENLIVKDPKHKLTLVMRDAKKKGFHISENYRFVAGTCFAIRSECLKTVQEKNIKNDEFVKVEGSRGLSYAHFLERYLCATVLQQGYNFEGNRVCKFKRMLKKPIETLMAKFSSERLFDEDIDIDPEYFLWRLDNKLIWYKFVERKIGKLKYRYDFKDYPFTKCPPYQYLKGDKEGYRKYCEYHIEMGLPQMSEERFDNLRESIQKNGFNQRNIIIINRGNVIADGQHRACCLCDILGEEAKVKMLLIYELGIKNTIKFFIPKPVLRYLHKIKNSR